MSDQGMKVSVDAVLTVTAAQRNTAHDRLAQMEALVQQLMAELAEVRAENARLRGETPVAQGQVSDAG